MPWERPNRKPQAVAEPPEGTGRKWARPNRPARQEPVQEDEAPDENVRYSYQEEPASFASRLDVMRRMYGDLSPEGYNLRDWGGIDPEVADWSDPKFDEVVAGWRKKIESSMATPLEPHGLVEGAMSVGSAVGGPPPTRRSRVPEGVTAGDVEAFMAATEPKPATLGELNTALAGEFVEGLYSIPKSLGLAAVEGDSEAEAVVRGMANPAIDTLGPERFAAAHELMSKNAMGRGIMAGTHLLGAVPSIGGVAKSLNALKLTSKATAGADALAVFGGLSADDDRLAAAGHMALFGKFANLFGKMAAPLKRYIKKLPPEQQVGAMAFFESGEGGFTFAAAGEAMAKLEGEDLLEYERVLSNGIFGVGLASMHLGRGGQQVGERGSVGGSGGGARPKWKIVRAAPQQGPKDAAPKWKIVRAAPFQGPREAPKPEPVPASAREGAPGRGEGPEKTIEKPAVEPAPLRPGVTSMKQRIQDIERAEVGQEPLQDVEPVTGPQRRAKAAEIVKADPTAPERLIEDLERTGRQHSPVESEIMLIRRVQLNDAFAKADAEGVRAAERGDGVAAASARAEADNILALRDRLDQVKKGSSREVARALESLKTEASREDYTQLGITMSLRRTADYKPLSAKETAQARDLSAEMKAAEAQMDKAVEAEAMGDISKIGAKGPGAKTPSPGSPKYGAGNRVFTRELHDKTLSELQARLRNPQANPFLDPANWADAIKIGGYHIEAGARSFGRWSKAMLKELGSEVEPHLRKLWAESDRVTAAAIREDSAGKVKTALAEGGRLSDMQREVGALAESLRRDGVPKEKLVSAVHENLKQADPAITRRDVTEALSGYGKLIKVSQDPIKKEIRELKSELLKELQIEDLLKGVPPRATGRPREAPTDKQRELARQVRELQRSRAATIKVPNSPKFLRSALDPVKTRLQNEIKDLDKQIASGKRLPSTGPKTKLELDAEAKDLVKRRDERRKVFNEIFGRKGLTEEQRIQLAIKAGERAGKELERRLKEGELFPETKGREELTSPELEAVRARNDALRAELKRRQLLARPKKTRDQIVNQTRLTNLARRHAELLEQLADPNLAPKAKKPPVEPSPAVLEAQARVNVVKQKVNDALFDKMLRDRNMATRIWDTLVTDAPDLSLAIKAGVDISIVARQAINQLAGHPIRTIKSLTTTLESIKSQARPGAKGFGKILGRTSEGQAREEAKLAARPLRPIALEAGLEVTDTSGKVRLKQTEEFRGRHIKKIPVLAAGARAFETQGNRIRQDSFDGLAYAWGRTAIPTLAEAQVYANYANITTGRPNLGTGGLAKTLDALGRFAWAPKLVISKFQQLALYPMWAPAGGFNKKILTKAGIAKAYKGTGEARAFVSLEIARSMIGYAIVVALARKAGADVTFDPNSPDFGKIIIRHDGDEPDTRIDIMGGLAQAWVFVSRMGTGEKTTGGGKTVDISGEGEGFKGATRGSVALRFGRSKLAPIPGTVVNLMTGSDFLGEENTPGSIASDLVTPLAAEDVFKSLKEHDLPEGVAASLMAIFGVGIQNYKRRGKKKKWVPKSRR